MSDEVENPGRRRALITLTGGLLALSGCAQGPASDNPANLSRRFLAMSTDERIAALKNMVRKGEGLKISFLLQRVAPEFAYAMGDYNLYDDVQANYPADSEDETTKKQVINEIENIRRLEVQRQQLMEKGLLRDDSARELGVRART